jgi:hypothetical protein
MQAPLRAYLAVGSRAGRNTLDLKDTLPSQIYRSHNEGLWNGGGDGRSSG